MTSDRKSYDESMKWNVGDIYKSKDDFERAFKRVQESDKKYEEYKGHIMDSSESLYNFLEFDKAQDMELESLYVYAHLQNDEDTRDTKFQEMESRAYKLYMDHGIASSYVVPEILGHDRSEMESYIKENPKLEEYSRMLMELYKFERHTLSKEEEEILSSISSSLRTPDEVYSLLTDADLKFGPIIDEEGQEVELTEKNYSKYIRSSDRSVRASAFKIMNNTFGSFKNTYAALLSNNVSNDNKISSLRHYDSALEASLYANDIPTSVYETLISTVKKNVSPLSKFWKLKKQILEIDDLHIYDTYTALENKNQKEYSAEDAKKLIIDSLSILGEDYINALNCAFDERWIDYPANAGKRNGAYCTAVYKAHPYVLVNFDNTLNGVSTLAHELGHALHYHYAIKNRTFEDYNYTIFVAEVASQVNQILLNIYLIEHTDDTDTKKCLIDELIQDFKASVYRQTMFADFELEIHNREASGEVLTHELLCKIYYDLNKEYYGENIVVDEEIKYEWERIPHFYSSFYVYQYATSYIAAIKIANDILNNKEEAKEKYIEFLGLGCTKDPIESLKVAGIDMMSEDTYKSAFAYFESLVENLQELYKEV